jgi:hypothetical protein
MARRLMTGNVGGFAAPIDTTNMDEETKRVFQRPKNMNKTERDFVAGSKDKKSATEAVRRARTANKQPPIPEV